MLKVLYQKLSSSSKGELNHHPNSHKLQIYRVGKTIVQGIPVLSIFALFGLTFYAITSNFNTLECSAGCGQSSCPPGYALDQSYCCEKLSSYPSPDASASLNISGSDPDAVISTGRGTVAYREHTVQVSASHIASYSLTLSGDAELTLKNGTEKLSGINNTLGANIPADHWGYGWGNPNTDKTNLYYNTPSPTPTTLASGNANNYQINFSNQLVFAAHFGEDAPAGNYQANVMLSLAATPATVTSYSVTYNANGGSGTVPTTQTADSIETSHSFTAAEQGNLTKSGHDFLGWAESSSATTAQYAAGSTITLTQSTPSKTLYAVWKQEIKGLKSITTMQQMTSTICTDSSIGDSTTLTDTRTNNYTYTVAKLSDNRCWMTQNLRLAGETTITSADSNVASSYTIPKSTASFVYPEPTLGQMRDFTDEVLGAHYSYNAATAGTMAGKSGNNTYDICPIGWRLPYNSDYNNLINKRSAYTSATYGEKTYNGYYYGGTGSNSVGATFFPAAGIVYAFSVSGTAAYWTGTALSTAKTFNLGYSSTDSGSVYNNYRDNGFSIRCIAK